MMLNKRFQYICKNITAALAYTASVAVILLFFSACGNRQNKLAELKTLEDTLAYSMGSMQKIKYMHFIETSCKVDSTYRERCFEGIEKGYFDKKYSPSFYDGINIGIQAMFGFVQLDKNFTDKQFVDGLIDGAFNQEQIARADTTTMSDIYKQGIKHSLMLSEYAKEVNYTGKSLDEFIEGFKVGTSSYEKPEEYAFVCGLMFGNLYLRHSLNSVNMQIYGKDTTKSVSPELFYAGFMECNLPNAAILHSKANDVAMMADYKIKDSLYSENRIKGEKFLEENKTKPGVVTLPSGLQYKIIKEGRGKIPAEDSKVEVHYIGKTIDGTVFDDTHRYNKPVPMDVKHTNSYYKEVLKLMPVGSVWEIYIPQQMAFAATQTKFFKPFSTVIYEIELIKITQ